MVTLDDETIKKFLNEDGNSIYIKVRLDKFRVEIDSWGCCVSNAENENLSNALCEAMDKSKCGLTDLLKRKINNCRDCLDKMNDDSKLILNDILMYESELKKNESDISKTSI